MAVQIGMCGIYIVLGALLCRKFLASERKREGFPALAAILIFGGALALRLILGVMYTGYETDMNTFKGWAGLADSMGLNHIYYSE